jgi:hypothetical protein
MLQEMLNQDVFHGKGNIRAFLNGKRPLRGGDNPEVEPGIVDSEGMEFH